MPINGLQSAIDKPESVNLVSPPMIIINKDIRVKELIQTNIALFVFIIKLLKSINIARKIKKIC